MSWTHSHSLIKRLNLLAFGQITCDGWGSDAIGNTWNVPENCGANKMKVKEEMGWKLGQREASVQRYKEKRQNRLFAKRIRYEVRKLNAEKRPRMKVLFHKSLILLQNSIASISFLYNLMEEVCINYTLGVCD